MPRFRLHVGRLESFAIELTAFFYSVFNRTRPLAFLKNISASSSSEGSICIKYCKLGFADLLRPESILCWLNLRLPKHKSFPIAFVSDLPYRQGIPISIGISDSINPNGARCRLLNSLWIVA